jgi:hypothetical protein
LVVLPAALRNQISLSEQNLGERRYMQKTLESRVEETGVSVVEKTRADSIDEASCMNNCHAKTIKSAKCTF